MIAVEVDELEKRYGDSVALKKISFEVNRGELFGLIGPDGAGKTTLLRILATLLLADKGRTTIHGYDTVREYRTIRNLVGYMPGRFSLYQDLTVEENLRFFATLFGTTVEENYGQIKDIYDQLSPFKRRRAGKLSGGMKQKLALCCALIHKPEILFLDEPTSGVDAVSRKEFWGILHRLKRQGITILVSTPYMDEAMRCDRIVLIQNGIILSIDSPAEILQRYPGPLFAVKADDIYGLLKFARELEPVELSHAFGEYLHITLKDKRAGLEQLHVLLEECRFPGLEIRRINPTIEDCFIRLMSEPELNGNRNG